MKYALFYLMLVNYVAFTLVRIDKIRAQEAKERIPERNLLLISAFGGSFGAYMAMNKYRHKTKKQPFRYYFFAIVLVQVILSIAFLRVV